MRHSLPLSGEGDVIVHHDDATRRRAPRIWDTDWLVLRGLSRELDRMLANVRVGGEALDFGCGVMPYRALVEKRGLDYCGADFASDADVTIGPDGRLPQDIRQADVVMSMQVLEHVADLDLYFAEAMRAMKHDGTLILSTHGSWLYHPHPQDHRRWTRTGLQYDIEQRGFAVHEVVSIVGPLATTTIIRLTGFAWAVRRVPVVGGVLANALAVVMNARAWVEDKLTPHQVSDYNGCIYLVRCLKAASL
ncbi:methyltransferase domain-containing protein [Sphingobium sp.]|uniref:class I SAM-dependent methyltransferase n=1 Tax=Sphingobium sp. TaxID=1912891 RepID=UPI0025F59F90|nr:methyltransferase domain-containing protein [Sphingobium sp.]